MSNEVINPEVGQVVYFSIPDVYGTTEGKIIKVAKAGVVVLAKNKEYKFRKSDGGRRGGHPCNYISINKIKSSCK